jgi:phage terminase large subunit
VNIRFAPEITNVYERNFNSKGRIVINRGGTRSSKTYSLSQLAIRWLLTGRVREHQVIPKGIFSIVRKTFPSLKASALRDVVEILEEHNIMQYIQYNKTDHVMTLPGSGRYLEFFSVDQQQKVRSRGRSILYCVEANELDYMSTFYQMLMRTKDLVLIDLNPDDPYNWINEELEQKRAQKRGDVEVIVSTYKDNPKLSPEHVQEIEYMKEVDEELWQVYGLGQYGKITGLIFPNIQIVKTMPENLSSTGYGLDFGYVNDPSAMVYGGVQNKIDLYLDEILYQSGLTNPDLAGAFRTNSISSSVEIFADSAEPKSITELRQYGYNVIGAKKGPDSVLYGIKNLQKFKIHITENSHNLLKELIKYKWKVDKEGKQTNVPIDMFNHGIDGARYYAIMKLSRPDNASSMMSGIDYSNPNSYR